MPVTTYPAAGATLSSQPPTGAGPPLIDGTLVTGAAATKTVVGNGGAPLAYATDNPIIVNVNGTQTNIPINTPTLIPAFSGSQSLSVSPQQSLPGTVTSVTDAQSWSSIAYGNGYFVAVAGGPAPTATVSPTTIAAWSTNGSSWTAATLPVSTNWQSVAYGAGVFVAVARTGDIAYSSNNGTSWTGVTLFTGASTNLSVVAFLNSKFYAMTNNGSLIASSSDGINWSAGGGLTSNTEWGAFAYNGGTYIALGTNTTLSNYSSNATTWTPSALPSSHVWSSIIGSSSTTFVAVAGYNPPSGGISTNVAAITTNGGSSWSAVTMSASSSWAGIAYGNGTYVAVANAAGAAGTVAGWSTNGTTWTAATLPSAIWTSVVYVSGSTFIAIATTGATAISTNSGSTWTSATTMTSATAAYALVVGASSLLVAITASTLASYSSNNGTTWTNATIPTTGVSYYGIAYGSSTYVAVGVGGAVLYSTNSGVTWTAATIPGGYGFESIIFDGTNFIALSDSNSNIVATSSNGSTWTISAALPNSTSQAIGGLAYGNGKYVAVGGLITNSTTSFYSSDGITWTTGTLPSSSPWNGIVYGGSGFVAVAGEVAATSNGGYSLDGITWTATSMPASAFWSSVAYYGGLYLAVSGSATQAGSAGSTINASTAMTAYAAIAFQSLTGIAISTTGLFVACNYNHGFIYGQISAALPCGFGVYPTPATVY